MITLYILITTVQILIVLCFLVVYLLKYLQSVTIVSTKQPTFPLINIPSVLLKNRSFLHKFGSQR